MGFGGKPPPKLPSTPVPIAAPQAASTAAIGSAANQAAQAREAGGAGLAGTILTSPLGAQAPRTARNALASAPKAGAALGASRTATVTGNLFGQ